jgi:hypothetical protein
MEGGLCKMWELSVSLLSGLRVSPGHPWKFLSEYTMCTKVLIQADAGSPADLMPNHEAALGALLALGVKARVAEVDGSDGFEGFQVIRRDM